MVFTSKLTDEYASFSPKDRGTINIIAEKIEPGNWITKFSFKWLVTNHWDRGCEFFCCYLPICRRRVPVKFRIEREIPGLKDKYAEVYSTEYIHQLMNP